MQSSTVTGNDRTNHRRLMRNRSSYFVKLYSIIKKIFSSFLNTFLSSKAIDRRSKNWVAVLKKFAKHCSITNLLYTVNPCSNGPGYNRQNLAVYNCEFLKTFKH
jgi:hypothetical protein